MSSCLSAYNYEKRRHMRRRPGQWGIWEHLPPPTLLPPQKKNYNWQKVFLGKCRVKLGHFVSHTYFFGQKCLSYSRSEVSLPTLYATILVSIMLRNRSVGTNLEIPESSTYTSYSHSARSEFKLFRGSIVASIHLFIAWNRSISV